MELIQYRILSRHEFIQKFGSDSPDTKCNHNWNMQGHMDYLFGMSLEVKDATKSVIVKNASKDTDWVEWTIHPAHIVARTEPNRFIMTVTNTISVLPYAEGYQQSITFTKGLVFTRDWALNFASPGSDIRYVCDTDRHILNIPFTANLLKYWEDNKFILRF